MSIVEICRKRKLTIMWFILIIAANITLSVIANLLVRWLL